MFRGLYAQVSPPLYPTALFTLGYTGPPGPPA